MNRLLLLLQFALISTPILAEPRPARDLVIPIAGRTSGALGSEWRTDVVVGNAGESAVQVGVSFYPSGQFDPFLMFDLAPSETRVISDLQTRMGVLGYVRVTAGTANARLVAHARIYNTKGARQKFGQIVEGIPFATLGPRVQVFGIRGEEGTRTNLGLTAPVWGIGDVRIRLLDAEGVVRSERVLVVEEVVQINDVFAFFDVPPGPGSVTASTSGPIAAYISIVDTESGDADFIAGASFDQAVSDVVAPACAVPATLELNVRPGPGYIVMFKQGAGPARELTDALRMKYGFVVRHYYTEGASLQGFSAIMSHEVVAALRCESAIEIIYENSIAILL